MVNTGTVAAGGVQPREIRDVPGSEIMGISIIGLRGLRISWWMLPPFVSLLRIWPDIITGKSKRRKKNYARTCQVCLSFRWYSAGSLWIRGTRGSSKRIFVQGNVVIGMVTVTVGYIEPEESIIASVPTSLGSISRWTTSNAVQVYCPIWILFFFPLASRQRALSILSILKPLTFVVNCRQNWKKFGKLANLFYHNYTCIKFFFSSKSTNNCN